MERDALSIQAVKTAFNKIKVTRGQVTNIATCDSQGNPNVAPIGSMRVVDENTVHVLQGFLHKTCCNLESNPKAAFVICLQPKWLDTFNFFKKKENLLGYQVYCEFIGGDDSKEIIEHEYRQILQRFPFVFRGLFLKFCEAHLKRLLKFRILDIREIVSPITS